MWDWWSVVSRVRRSTVAGLRNGSGPGTGMWGWWSVVSRVPGKSEDRGRKTHGPGTENPWTGDGKEEDLGRECGTGGLWCRGSRGKVRTGDGKPMDRGWEGGGPGTGMWNWWSVVSRVPGKSEDRGRKTHGPGTERRRTGDGNVGLMACGVAGPGEK